MEVGHEEAEVFLVLCLNLFIFGWRRTGVSSPATDFVLNPSLQAQTQVQFEFCCHLNNKTEIIQAAFSFGTAYPQLNNICILTHKRGCALCYATGQLFGSDIYSLSKSSVQHQNIWPKYGIHGIGYVLYLFRWAFF